MAADAGVAVVADALMRAIRHAATFDVASNSYAIRRSRQLCAIITPLYATVISFRY